MDDTDRFLLEALEQSGCLSTSAVSVDLRQLDSDAFIAIVRRCLALIQASEPHLDLSLASSVDAPIGVAARHRMGSKLANIFKELGYAGDCGYNHFLYPDEKETRSMLSWIVGKLPRADTDRPAAKSWSRTGTERQRVVDPLSEDALAGVFSSWMKRRTLPVLPNRHIPHIRGHQKLDLHTEKLVFPWQSQHETGQEVRGLLFDVMPAKASRAVSVLEAIAVAQSTSAAGMDSLDDLADQSDASSAAFWGRLDRDEPLVASKNPVSHSGFHSMPPFFVSAANVLRENTLPVNMSQEPSATETSVPDVAPTHVAAEDTQLEQMHQRLADTQQRIEQLQAESERDQREIESIQQQVEILQSETLRLSKELTDKKKLLSLLPNAEENIGKLETLCSQNDAKLKELEAEWEAHKLQLQQEEEALLSLRSNRKSRARLLVAEMRTFRAEMKKMVVAIQEKMDAIQELDKAHAQLPSNVSRTSYTNRIMDIIKQVHKQKHEIDKIIDDIKAIQKQLNFSSEKLKRTEAVTEDKLFSEANKQTASKDPNNPYVECYRKFAQVRELFEDLISVTGDVGKKENTARDLENWITQLQGRDSTAQLERVLADLKSVRLENTNLADQLRALRSLPTL